MFCVKLSFGFVVLCVGCPFKTMNEDQLNAMLRRLGVTGTPLKESLQLAKNEDFQIACHKSFNGPSTSLLHTRLCCAESFRCVEARRVFLCQGGTTWRRMRWW